MAEHDSELHREVKRRAVRGFWIHLAVYVVVNGFLAYLDLSRNPDQTWFYWPLAGWGLGIVLHGVLVFCVPQAIDRRVARIQERQHRQHGHGATI